jgi:polyhydroxyalkanoate synthesis repressor PhaR
MTRLIKRYANRKLYDSKASRYVTLDRIAALVRAGDDVRIIDNDTGEDLTAVTFAQIIFEEAKRKNGPMQTPLLRRIIEQGGETLQEILTGVDRGREALENVRELAEKRVRELVAGPHPRKHRPGKKKETTSTRGLIDGLVGMPQKQLEQLQQRIDSQVRASIDRVTNHPAFQAELHRIEDGIRGLEQQLTRLRQRGGHHSGSRSGKGRPRSQAKKGSGGKGKSGGGGVRAPG